MFGVTPELGRASGARLRASDRDDTVDAIVAVNAQEPRDCATV
jgi:hypothetical protein